MKRLIGLFVLFSAASPVWAGEAQRLEEIVVTDKVSDVAARRESATQKIVMDRKEIEDMGVMTIGEVLGKLPGVELVSMSGGASAQRARGMSRDSVQILVDGERSAGGSAIVGGVIGRLPSGDLERVEILRGSSAEYGGAAPVTVNLVMKKALPKSSTEVRVGLGRRGEEPYSQLSWKRTGGEGGFSWSFPVSLIWSDSPVSRAADRQDTAAGTRTLWQQENERGVTKVGHHSIAPRMTWKNGGDSLTVAPLFFYGPKDSNTDTALTAYADPAAGAGLASNGDRNSREDGLHRVLRLRVEGEKHLGESKLTARAAVANSRKTLDKVTDAHDASGVLTTYTESSRSTDNEFNLALRLDRPTGLHLVSMGAEYADIARNDNQNFGGGFVAQDDNDASSREGILWVQDEWGLLESITLTAGLRAESMELNADGASRQRLGWLPSVAVRWEPADKWVMRFSAGAGMKMPKVEELSNATLRSVAANTPVEADRRGNPDLRPERSVNFEALLERYLSGEAGVLGANLYARSTRDFTERRVQLEGQRWVDRPCNEGSAVHWGVELDGKLRTDSLGWKGATVKAHLTLPRAEVDDTRLGIRRMARDTPRYILSAGLDENLPKLQSSYGISLQLSGRGETDIPGEQSGYTKAKTTLDAFWLYKLSNQFKLRLSGQNLLAADTVRETQYTSAGNTWQSRTVEGGYRTVMATVEGNW